MAEDGLEVRQMRPEEISQAVDIWKEQGLEEGENNVKIWYEVDPEGFYVAVDTDTEQVVGTCAAVRQHESLFFVGMYAVRKSYQGRGIGPRVWQVLMNRVGENNAGLNAVPKHLSTYRDRAGFSYLEPWSTLVYNTTNVTPEKLQPSSEGLRVVPIDDDILPKLIEYDTEIHGYDRHKAVTLTLQDEDGCARAVVRQGDDGEDVVCGFGKLSANILGGALASPLYADDRDAAGVLIRELVENFEPSKHSLTMMVLDCNDDACALAEDLGLSHYMKVPRCYRIEGVQASLEKIYAQHDLNFTTF
ncbi:uncharacterized protein LOC135366857 [Ornithodoros turicata]